MIFRAICLLGFSIVTDGAAQRANYMNLMANETVRVKLTMLDLTTFSQPTFKVHGEYVFRPGEKPFSAGLDLGYVYYSADEQVKARGLFTGGRVSFYRKSTAVSTFSMSLSAFRSEVFLNDYLKYTSTYPGLGEYNYYEKTRYSKLRRGCAFEFVWQRKLIDFMFVEISTGVGLVKFETHVPYYVTQRSFVNGLTSDKSYKGPNLFFSVKLGYAFL